MGSGATFVDLFRDVPQSAPSELFDVLVKSEKLSIERIVSTGQVSQNWYNQDENEFCCVLKGAAELLVEGNDNAVRMNAGDSVMIPAHVRHRVSWTDQSQPTVWLAVKWKHNSMFTDDGAVGDSASVALDGS